MALRSRRPFAASLDQVRIFAAVRVVIVIVVAWVAGCSKPQPPPKPRDVLLITIDTARADRFSYTGAAEPGTPTVDGLAREGIGFVNAISPAPLTKPAHASLMTGRLPPSHTVRDNGSYRLPDTETTLAEILRGAGFTTAAFVGAQVLDARYGFNQGFTTYDDHMPPGGDPRFLMYAERNAQQVVDAAKSWLAVQGDGPVFAWVHFFDAHAPYRPPEPERSRHAAAYDGEIAYVDRMLGDLLDAWRARRGRDRTLVVVTADHGEALGEHGEATHGVLVHDATIRVPLVIAAPGLHRDEVVREPVSLIDVLPTVLAVLGLPAQPKVQGRDLSPLLRGDPIAWSSLSGYAESMYAELHHGCTPLLALREGGWKVVQGKAAELFDLARDPREEHDVAPAEPTRAKDLGDELAKLVHEIDAGVSETATLDDEARRALESLGYSWSPTVQRASGAAARDPREALTSMRRMAEADRSAARNDIASAVAAYRAVLADEPESVDARVRLAAILMAANRSAEAAHMLAAAVVLAPKEAELHRRLGDALAAGGKFREALSSYEKGLALNPPGHEVRDARWQVLNRMNQQNVLLAEAERAVAADPSDGMARYARALACCGQGRLEDYVAALQRELAALPSDPILQRAMAEARAEGTRR